MWVTVTKRSMKQTLIIRSSKSTAKHSCLADLGVIWEKCGTEERVCHNRDWRFAFARWEHYLALILYIVLKISVIFFESRKKLKRKEEKQDIEKLEQFRQIYNNERNEELYAIMCIWKFSIFITTIFLPCFVSLNGAFVHNFVLPFGKSIVYSLFNFLPSSTARCN